MAGFLAAIAPVPASADNDKDHGDNNTGIHAEIAALKAQVATLQDQVKTLQTANADLQNEVTTLQSRLAAVQSNHALLLGPFVNVDPNPEVGVRGPNIVFSGANIHIVSGSGRTDDNSNPTGLGNLIVGYDEDPTVLGPSGRLNPGDRGGSHNLVVGPFHRFTHAAFGGLVVGIFNTISGSGTSVSGGFGNTASDNYASVSGGAQNTASGQNASVSGGHANISSGDASSVLGGNGNTAGGSANTVLGGQNSTATSGFANSILGGAGNTTGNLNDLTTSAVVLGGTGVSGNTNFSIAPQPPFP